MELHTPTESDADAHANRKVREWRAMYGPKDITDLGGICWSVFTLRDSYIHNR